MCCLEVLNTPCWCTHWPRFHLVLLRLSQRLPVPVTNLALPDSFQARQLPGPCIRLPCPPGQVMQALVEHFAAAGRPEAVERCVLKMDLLSLDLNQVRSLASPVIPAEPAPEPGGWAHLELLRDSLELKIINN